MNGSDIVVGWVEDGVPHFQDRHGSGEFTAELDSKQDWELLEGLENDTHTVLVFRRNLRTCDEQDIDIDSNYIFLIYGYSDEDLSSPAEENQHLEIKGSRRVGFLQPPIPDENTFGEDVWHWDLKMPNISVWRPKPYFHWTKVFKTPVLNSQNQIIKFEMIVQPGNEKHVHHMELFECVGNEDYLEEQSHTDGQEWIAHSFERVFMSCAKLVAITDWGSKSLIFPYNAGLPIAPHRQNYYNLEIHYEIWDMKEGASDSSGMRLFITPRLRRNDVSLLRMGSAPFPAVFIPPGQRNFLITAHSHPKCLDPVLPPEGIKIIGGKLHMHELGRKITVRQFRGKAELSPIMRNDHFQPKHQDYIFFRDEITIQQGDQITLECTYDSTSRNQTTFGGLTSDAEMCIVHLIYFPGITRYTILSFPNLATIRKVTGVSANFYDIFSYELAESIRPLKWSSENATLVQNELTVTPHTGICYLNAVMPSVLSSGVSYPSNLKPYSSSNVCPEVEDIKAKNNRIL